MRKKLLIILIILIVSLGGVLAYITNQNRDHRTPYQVLVDHYAQLHHFSGNVFLYHQGDTLIHESRGLQKLNPDLQNELPTRFAIGSVSKHFAATLILLLEEEGKLSVNDPIKNYISDLPQTWNEITIHHLLTHTSGIANSTEIFNTPEMINKGRTLENSYQIIKETPLAFKPGSEFSYCNTGYNYLAMIIENLTSESFEENLVKRIFQPLGMNNSGSIKDFSKVKNLAQGFSTKNNMIAQIEERGLVPELLKGAGGIYSNTKDMFIWDRALRENKLLSKTQTDKMFTPDLDHYGYGWRIREIEIKGQTYQRLSHSGHLDGFMANFIRIPELDFCLILLSNNQDTPIKDLSKGLIEIALNQTAPDSLFLPSNGDLFAAYAGIYEMEDGTIMEISFYDKGVNMKSEGYPQLPFVPTGGHGFKSAYPFVPAKLNFILNEKNTIIAMEFIYEDETRVAKKK